MSQLVDLATVGLFPTLKDFSVDALKWTDLEEGVVYYIVSTKVVHTQHGQAVVLSLRKEDGTGGTAWACGMLSAELLGNPMLMVGSNLFVVATGEKTSKSTGRVYNSYKIMSM